MKTAFWLAGATVLALAQPALAADSIKIGFVSTFSGPTAVIGNDMRNSFELALDHHGPQDGRQAGRGDLRGRRPEAGCRQAEDRKADPVRQGRFHRRLYLVERAAGLAQDRGRFQDLPDLGQCRARRSSPANSARLTCSRPPGRTTRPRRPMGTLHEPEGRQVGVPDRPELCRRQGHAGRRQEHVQGRGRWARNTRCGRASSTSPPNSPRRRTRGRSRSSCSIRALPACSSSTNMRQAGIKAQIPLYTAFTIDELSLPLQKENALGVPGAPAVGQRPAERREQAVRRGLPQEVHRPASDLLRRAVL